MWKATGKKPPGLEGPEFPPEFTYIWEWFREVFYGGVLTYQELQSWSQVTGKRLSVWEAELIMALVEEYWKVANE